MKTSANILSVMVVTMVTPIFANATWPSFWFYSNIFAFTVILPVLALEVGIIYLLLKVSVLRVVAATVLANGGSALIGLFILQHQLSAVIWLNVPLQLQPFSPKDLLIHAIVILFVNFVIESIINGIIIGFRQNISLFKILRATFIANLTGTAWTMIILRCTKW